MCQKVDVKAIEYRICKTVRGVSGIEVECLKESLFNERNAKTEGQQEVFNLCTEHVPSLLPVAPCSFVCLLAWFSLLHGKQLLTWQDQF